MSKRYPGGIIRKTPQTPSQTSAQGIWDMASVTQAVKENTWPIAGVPDPISKSLRFRNSASAYLSRTPASAGNRRTWTWSGWVKRGALGSFNPLLQANYSGTPWFVLGFANNDKIEITQTAGSSASWESTAVFRDPSAWYHIVCVVDTTSATSTMNGSSTDRFRLYVNGTQYVISGGSVPSQNADLQVNNTVAHTIGGYGSSYTDGYLAETYFIDGQALTPSSFGSTNDQTGVWQPIAYTGTYGTNGFYLPFSNTASTATLGYDFSGNSNNWTTNNISLTTGTSIQTFSTTGTTSWTAPTGVTSVSYLVVAGGGSGGAGNGGGGGGGAGGLLTGTLSVTPGNSYTVTVGAGGTGTGAIPYRNSGGNSVFGSITATGGGGGGYDGTYPPLTGGSGGGGNYSSTAGAAGTSGQGFAGGNNTGTSPAFGGGGGGGSSAVGAVGTSSVGGNGGAGTTSSISGSSVTYAGGGGGGTNSGQTVGTGTAGGGNGGTNSGTGGNATANTGSGGGGGGGGSAAGGNGGSGIVILSWTNSASTYDSMNDVPTQWIPYNTAGDTGALWRGNYSVMNPLDSGATNSTLSNGNLTVATASTGFRYMGNTMWVASGKFYAEFTLTATTGYAQVGIAITTTSTNKTLGEDSTSWSYNSWNGTSSNNNSPSSFGNSWTTNDVIGIALDKDNNKLYFSKNGTWQNSADPAAGTGSLNIASIAGLATLIGVCDNDNGGSVTFQVNFGQRPFAYAPPSGFKTLNTTNLPTPTIGATASTTANKYFDATTYTGNGATGQTIVNSGGFQPNFVWAKSRSNAYDHGLQDIVRGATKDLNSNNTDAEETRASSITAFASNGFTVGNDVIYNGSGSTYVGWQWAGGGTGVSNTAGSITSTVSANTTAGFSIVTYTGTGSNATVGHGLGVAPSVIIIKARNTSPRSWMVGLSSLNNWNNLLQLNTSDASVTDSTVFNGTAPTSSVFSIGTNSQSGANGTTYVAYCFAQVAGYSAFGSYTGNGSTNGPFVFTGFRPAFVMVKRSSAVTAWYMFDKARDTYNVVEKRIEANTSGAEASGLPTFDFLSNGFKLRDSDAAWNGSGSTYIYMAFAEAPFKYALAR